MTDRARRLAVPKARRVAIPSAEDDALSRGVALVAAPVCFGLLGYWIDSMVGTGWVLAAVFATFGVLGSVTSLYCRYEARIARLDEGKPWMRRSAG